MLDRPDFPEEKIAACLQTDYGLSIAQVTFLPFGTDLSTVIYRSVAEDGKVYFCKLKLGEFDETSVEIPKLLSDQGIGQIIPPLVTKTGKLRAELDNFKLIVYPFIEGRDGYGHELTEPQWAEFGSALKRIHTTAVPPALRQNIRKEDYSPEFREECTNLLKSLETTTFDDPVIGNLYALLEAQRDPILKLIEGAQRLAPVVAARDLEFVLCHADMHPGNLFLVEQASLFIVDWDYPRMSPKERDLMFIGGGHGFVNRTAQEEESFFYQAYGPADIDPIALAYYRYERNLFDIAVLSGQVLTSKEGGKDRAQFLEYLGYSFLPNGPVEIALQSNIPQTL
jgi:spectinomycin phosphotransferase